LAHAGLVNKDERNDNGNGNGNESASERDLKLCFVRSAPTGIDEDDFRSCHRYVASEAWITSEKARSEEQSEERSDIICC